MSSGFKFGFSDMYMPSTTYRGDVMVIPLPPKSAWQTFATNGAVMKMWFHTDATSPLSNGLT